MTRIGLGLAALGRPGYINLGHASDLPGSYQVDNMRDHAHTVLDAAWAAGIRYFDAARSYGKGEDFLGTWLSSRRIASSDVTIGSKWGYTYTADWQVTVPEGVKHEVKDHSLAVLDRQIRESQAELGNHLDIYQIHSATLESQVFDNVEVLDRLAKLRDSGWVIGFSTSGPRQADAIRKGLDIARGGRPLFRSVQATWNLLEQSAGEALEEAHRAGCGVIVKEGLANGRLTSRNTDPKFRERHEMAFQFASEHHVTLDAVALACALRQPWADVVLSGAATTDQLSSNVQSLQIMNQPHLDCLLEWREPTEDYWSIRGGLAWN